MSSIYDEFEEVIRRHKENDERSAQRAKDDERFSRLESTVGRLADSVEQFVKGSAPSAPPESGGDGSEDPTPDPSADPSPPDPPAPELPVERVTKLPVPKLWNGDDEPSEVPYIDPDTGETKKRPGRRKGHPYAFSIEAVEPEPPKEGDE